MKSSYGIMHKGLLTLSLFNHWRQDWEVSPSSGICDGSSRNGMSGTVEITLTARIITRSGIITPDNCLTIIIRGFLEFNLLD
jgi:hypothetical protein